MLYTRIVRVGIKRRPKLRCRPTLERILLNNVQSFGNRGDRAIALRAHQQGFDGPQIDIFFFF